MQLYSNLTSGDILHFLYYNAETDEILVIAESYTFISNDVVGDFVEPWQLHIQTTVDFNINLTAGWNWISLNVVPEDNTLPVLLESLGDAALFIGSQSSGTANYYVDYDVWEGGLSTLEPGVGYHIKMEESAMLIITGVPVDVSSHPISLLEGWNWIGYLPQNPGDVATALESLSDNAIFIGSQSSGTANYYVDYDVWEGGLSTLEPGVGYHLKMSADDILIYPDVFDGFSRIAKNKKAVMLNETISDWEFNCSDYEFIGTITASIENREDMDGDIIAAFTGDECRGIAERIYFFLDDRYYYIIQVYSNEIDGEELTFKYYDSLNDEIIEYTESIEFENNIIVGDGFKTFALEKPYLIPEAYSLDNAYPNPFNPATTLRFGIPLEGKVSLIIYNLQGREVSTLIEGNMDAGYHSVVWNADSHSSGLYFVKMIAGEYVNTQKLMLVK